MYTKTGRPKSGPFPVADLYSAKSDLALLGDAGSLAHLVAQVVELGATDLTVTHDLELGDLRGVNREGTLDADAIGDLADREGLARTGTLETDDVALEDLDALAITLLDAVVHLDVVADQDARHVLADLLTLDCADVIHDRFLTLLEVPHAYAGT